MANVLADRAMVARAETHPEEGRCYYSWLKDYLERLEGKDAYRKFQEHHDQAREYYVLMASLLA